MNEKKSIEELDHLSATSLKMFLRCPYQFFCRYVLGLKIQPGSALTLGKSVDTGLKINYEQKIESHEDLPEEDILGIYSSEFDSLESETLWEEGEDKGAIKDIGIGCLKAFRKEICPNVQPKEVDVEKKIKFEEIDVELVGYFDLLDQEGIVDNKTASKKWAADQPRKEMQSLIYPFLIDPFGEMERVIMRYDVAVKTKKPYTQQLRLEIKKEQREGFLRYLAGIIEQIKWCFKTGIWLPRRDNFLCSYRKCGYAEMCEKANGLPISR